MKNITNIKNIFTTPLYILLVVFVISSCSTSQTAHNNDGIYGLDEPTKTIVIVKDQKSDFYQEYFSGESGRYDITQEDIITDIDDYDLIIIPDKFFNETMVAQMKEAKSKTNMELIIISERNAEMRDIAVQLADGQIEKPFNQQMIYELLVDLSAVNPA